jgi:3D (Asp-Asp-Asp) domain-containing protein
MQNSLLALTMILPVLAFSTGYAEPKNPFSGVVNDSTSLSSPEIPVDPTALPELDATPPHTTRALPDTSRSALRSKRVVATAYTSLESQTDSTPWITASGTTTRFGVVASNTLPIGTEVRFPDYFGDQVFIVEDRMNARYGEGRIDVWLPSNHEAIQFGVRRLHMEILASL